MFPGSRPLSQITENHTDLQKTEDNLSGAKPRCLLKIRGGSGVVRYIVQRGNMQKYTVKTDNRPHECKRAFGGPISEAPSYGV